VVIGAGFITGLLNLGLNLLQEALVNMMRDPVSRLALFFTIFIVTFVIQTWIGIGMTLVLLKIARGQHFTFGDIFSGGPHLFRLIGATILVGMITLACILIPVIGGVAMIPLLKGDTFAVALAVSIACYLLALVGVAYLMARLGQFYFLVVDRKAQIVESVRHSWAMTRNRIWTIVLLYISQVGVVIAGYLACCVGIIFAVPFCVLLQVVTYLALTGSEVETPPEKPVADAWEEDL
jgi:hypothetical protein